MVKENFLNGDEGGEETKLLTAAEILNCEDDSFVDVDVPQWGGVIRIKALSAKEAMKLTQLDKQESMIQVVSKGAIDKDGDRLFTDNQVETLKKKSFAAFIKIQKAAMKLNGLSTDEAKND